MTQLQSQRDHYPALDGLRGIAIIAVIIYHNFPYGNSLFGWLGVDLFFVLSGFLITRILMTSINQNPKKSFLKNFYIRRVLRIFPLYYLFLFVFLFLFPVLGILKDEVSDYQQEKWWFIFYMQNWLFSNNLPEKSQCLNHFWSLGVEEQYYIIWPFIIFLVRKPRNLIIILICLLILLFTSRCIFWNAHLSNFNYSTFYTFTRFDGIIIGSLVALIVQLKKDFLLNHTATIVTGLAILNFIFYYLNRDNQLPYLAFIGYTTFASMFGILVYELTTGDNHFLKKIFSTAILRFLGKISYGLYMFHWPIFYLLRKPIFDFIESAINLPVFYGSLLTSVITTLIAVILSVISYYLFEMQFLKLKKKFQ